MQEMLVLLRPAVICTYGELTILGIRSLSLPRGGHRTGLGAHHRRLAVTSRVVTQEAKFLISLNRGRPFDLMSFQDPPRSRFGNLVDPIAIPDFRNSLKI